jgi:hypothetical protein
MVWASVYIGEFSPGQICKLATQNINNSIVNGVVELGLRYDDSNDASYKYHRVKMTRAG